MNFLFPIENRGISSLHFSNQAAPAVQFLNTGRLVGDVPLNVVGEQPCPSNTGRTTWKSSDKIYAAFRQIADMLLRPRILAQMINADIQSAPVHACVHSISSNLQTCVTPSVFSSRIFIPGNFAVSLIAEGTTAQ